MHRAVLTALQPGVSTADLDTIAQSVMLQHDASSSFQTVFGYPATICVSVNEQVGHGIPSHRQLADGDLVKVDVGVAYEGYHTDCAMTHIVGARTKDVTELLSITQAALHRGISCAQAGRRVSDISHAIAQSLMGTRYHAIRHAFGHGIGQNLHESPQIANFGPPNFGPRLRSGIAIAIEPLVSSGSRYTRTLDDGWTTVTTDGSLSAHFEHTVLITDSGPEILTQGGEDNEAEVVKATNTGEFGEFVFRPKVPSDNHEIVEMAQREMNPILIEAWGRPVIPNEVTNDEGCATIVIETRDGQLAGFYTVTLGSDVMHLKTIVIDSKFQGLGLGKASLKAVEEAARARGVRTVELCVQSNNVRAIGFYRKSGYIAVATPYYKTILMRKTL